MQLRIRTACGEPVPISHPGAIAILERELDWRVLRDREIEIHEVQLAV